MMMRVRGRGSPEVAHVGSVDVACRRVGNECCVRVSRRLVGGVRGEPLEGTRVPAKRYSWKLESALDEDANPHEHVEMLLRSAEEVSLRLAQANGAVDVVLTVYMTPAGDAPL